MAQQTFLENLSAGFYLVTTASSQQELLKLTQTSEKGLIGEIDDSFHQLPYLSLKENLLLGIERKRRPKFINYAKLVNFDMNLFIKIQPQLTYLDQIKLQFIRFLLKEKGIIYLYDYFEELTIQETQWLLHFCQKLAQQQQICIFLFSTDEQLIHTNIIDEIL
ncbi:MAG TPA: hypothetical protein VK118_08320 [Tetragenococcus sp.]|nr:hypothetical protein [Tetragenococcus sp.]